MRHTHKNLDATAFDSHPLDMGDADPMASTANLVDAMLVFACGLMMSLVMRYNVDLANVQDIDVEQNLSEVENIDQMADDMRNGGAGYTELGTVYQDPATGKMYMITEGEVEGSSEADGATGTASANPGPNSARANGAD